MNNTTKNTIVFALKVDNEESYGEIANFIYKCEHHLDLTEKETRRVFYKYYLRNTINEPKEWANKIKSDIDGFSEMKQAHKVKNITDSLQIVYCLWVDENSDIIDLCNLYLLKQHYIDLNMIALFLRCEEERYFKVSQFLYTVAINDNKFYNECFFDCKGDVKRSQKNNIVFSRSFIPLQMVDKNNIHRLFGECKHLINKERLNEAYARKTDENEEYDDLLAGAIKILCDARKHSAKLFEENYIKVLAKLDVFAFALVCYLLCREKETITLSMLEKYAFQMQQYSNSVRQLAENIVFHSKTQKGVLAFRVHNEKSSYISNKYKVQHPTESFLEIVVSDFCRDNELGNIADNFIQNLEDKVSKDAFSGLEPKSFFDHSHNKRVKEIWREFYCEPEHIGKHFGLRIFQSVVDTFDGIFSAESHSSYMNLPGDSYLSFEGMENTMCMPGTRYHIVFPTRNVKKAIRKQDLSLDSGINLGNKINDYFALSVDEVAIEKKIHIPYSQLQKNEEIKKLADYIKQSLGGLDKDIVYISLNNFEDYMGEIIAKALIIALYQIENDMVVVLYQCTDNLKKGVFDTMRIFYRNAGIEGMFYDRKCQIVIYSKTYEETVLDLSSAINTDSINAYIAHMKCITSEDGYLNTMLDGISLEKGALSYIPCDVLNKVNIDGKKQTLFEHYTENVLKNNIQKDEFGCQLEHTHMRLGSTIHINKFYEAEILFGNKLFVSRFALLLVKDMKKEIENIEKLTLYGYGTYSETVLVQMIEYIRYLYPEKKNIDYIILEREEERRGFLHTDRIRYNRYFSTKEERIDYFKDRKVAIVVLINSTLKTHMRLINLFKEENEIDLSEKEWLIKNYAAVLVGNTEKNEYWKIENNRIKLLKEKFEPAPVHFIQVETNYEEPATCQQCFPTNPVAEVPLIEVNAASTIPNQAFGIIEDDSKTTFDLHYEMIVKEEEKLSSLKGEFVYGHVNRNENHFLYYFKTENICIKQREKIEGTLNEWKNGQKQEELQYNIIVSPMHFSNAGFVELVNNVVFNGNAILLRIDFDKEYRCNAYTKYSYLRNYIEQLGAINPEGVVRVHYVDDAIISGRTFHRAKSLIKSILVLNNKDSAGVEIKIFDKVFVLVDRNSDDSRNQYVSNPKEDFYAFIKVNISSLRNYGDSCVYCNLKKEADLLYDTASTKTISEYWKHCTEKFQLYSLEEYVEKHKTPDYDKNFRRLFCTHMAQCVLKENNYGNDKVKAIYLILKLLNLDYESRQQERFEYFLSYIKCISRPFLVFQKAIKEAIFDIMLLLIDAIIRKKSISAVIKEVNSEKPYLSNRKLVIQFNKLNANILQDAALSETDKRDLVKLLMKQLTELKSNYIIRPDRMDAIFGYMGDIDKQKFEKYYLRLIDRLVGASSDTNKSIWLDANIIDGRFDNVTNDFRTWILLENTRAFRDGIEKFYKLIYEENTVSEGLKGVVNGRVEELVTLYDAHRTYEMFSTFKTNNSELLEQYRQEQPFSQEILSDTQKKIERFIVRLPKQKLQFINLMECLKDTTNNWAKILDCLEVQFMDWYVDIQETQRESVYQTKLDEWINRETDKYQFNNFYKLLQKESDTSAKISNESIDLIACCVKVLELCRNSTGELLEKVQMLAVLFKLILQANKVQFIVENKEGSNLDEWKSVIEKKYNSLIEKLNIADQDKEQRKIHIKGKKQYSVIIEKAGSEDLNTEVSDSIQILLEQLENQGPKGNNYLLDKKHGVFLWKLEEGQRGIWISVENIKWSSEDVEFELQMAQKVRMIMMFYQEVRTKIFNSENDEYINEISHITKELSIYNSNKTYTHTKEFSREMFFLQAQNYFQDTEKSIYMENYPSYVLKLLADINISKYYRYGLRAELYKNENGFGKTATWGQITQFIGNNQKLLYCINEDERINIKIDVNDIDENEAVLCKNSPSSIQDICMLIYSLIWNAAEKNRGKYQEKELSVQDNEKCVIVEIRKEKGNLIIRNECEECMDIRYIKRRLHHIPDSEDDGISLWSFNCYIRQSINSIILAKMKEIEQSILENCAETGSVENIGKWIEKLTGDEYEIQPEIINEDGKMYFSVKLPIFMEKYQFDK